MKRLLVAALALIAGCHDSQDVDNGGLGVMCAVDSDCAGKLLCVAGACSDPRSADAATEVSVDVAPTDDTASTDTASTDTASADTASTDIGTDTAPPACAAGSLWSKRFGDAKFQVSYDVRVNASDQIAIAGAYDGIIDLGLGPLPVTTGRSIFVAAFACGGAPKFSKGFALPDIGSERPFVAIDGAGSVIVAGPLQTTIDLGGGVLTSGGSHDVFLAKFDATGAHAWSRRYGDADDQRVTAIAADSSGNIVLVGSFKGSIDFGGGPLSASATRMFVAKLDRDGKHLWSAAYDARANAVAIGPSGEVVFGGGLFGTASFGGAPLTSAGGADIFVTKLSASGAHVWSKRFGDADGQALEVLAIDSLGNIGLAGTFRGSIDFGGGALTRPNGGPTDSGNYMVVAKLQADGTYGFASKHNGGEFSLVYGASFDPSRNLIVTAEAIRGFDFGAGPLMGPTALVKFSPSGAYVSAKSVPPTVMWQWRSSAVADSNGDVLFTGRIDDSVDFGSGTITPIGSPDAFLAKLAL